MCRFQRFAIWIGEGHKECELCLPGGLALPTIATAEQYVNWAPTIVLELIGVYPKVNYDIIVESTVSLCRADALSHANRSTSLRKKVWTSTDGDDLCNLDQISYKDGGSHPTNW
jgi:hypothetical protein